MSLSNEERQVLDLIAAWQRANPGKFGPRIRDIEHSLETVLGLAGTFAITAAVLDMEAKGLLRCQEILDGITPIRVQTCGLLDRLAHETAD